MFLVSFESAIPLMTTKPPGQWAPEGRWTRTLAFRVSVMAAAMVQRQGSVSGRHLQQMTDQVAERSAFAVRTRLQGLVQLPTRGEGHPLWAPAQQIGRAGCSGR